MQAVRVLKMAGSRPVLDGVFGIHKPMGMSSAQVIRDCQEHFNPSNFFKPMIEQERANRVQESNTKRRRRGFGKNDIRVKMGHGGTLDPLATGVLILGIGKGTKSLQSFLDCTKTYETVVLFGASTDTYDRVGKILKKTGYDHITKPMVEEALKSFRGKLQQVPPLFSALKMEGKPLYEYAREGKPIPREIATREVDVVEMEMLEWYEPGTHSHRWPAEEATSFERQFAEQVWKIEKDQTTKEKRSPEEEQQENKALEAHEKFKKKAEASVDALVYDKRNKRKKANDPPALMSGALGDAPPARQGKGSNLLPPPPDPNTPPPWDDKGPPAARIRMTVTSGFYVRSFCHDLGLKVGSAAMMAELCRSRQGDFVLGSPNCLEYDALAKGESVWAPQISAALAQWNGQPNKPGSQTPARATRPVSPGPGKARPSVESASPKKRKASEEAEENAQPKKTNAPPASRERKSASPQAAEKAQDAATKSDETKSGEATVDPAEEEWNGIEDKP